MPASHSLPNPIATYLTHMKYKFLTLVGLVSFLVLGSTYSAAQTTGNGMDNPDWVEESAPPPPAFSKDRLIPLEMPHYVSVKVGVDPQTIVVGADGVVRYVIVMANASGSSTAVYEGVRCVTDEVKTYARLSSNGSWSVLENPVWKSVTDNMPSRHAQAFARQGGCQNRLATSTQEIVNMLKSGPKAPQMQMQNWLPGDHQIVPVQHLGLGSVT